jgi:hypothetical protein
MRPIGVADWSWSVVDALLAHVPPLPSSCVQVAVTGTGPDFSKKKIRPHGPAFTSPWGRITVAQGTRLSLQEWEGEGNRLRRRRADG